MSKTESFSGLVPLGNGRSLYLRCAGIGGPTVILESGYGHSGRVWETDILPQSWRPPPIPRTTVFDGVRDFTRVCLYDRPGTVLSVDGELTYSRSDPVPMPRSAGAIVDDLHTALTEASIAGPYVYVGHSLGGLLGRVYAARYPGEIVGMVLVDAFSGELWRRVARAMSPQEWHALQDLETAPRQELRADYPAVEMLDLDALIGEESAASREYPLNPMPLCVLTRGQPLESVVPANAVPPGFRWDVVEREALAAQKHLRTLAPGATHVIASHSGHLIQLDQPALVIEAIRSVTEAARGRAVRI